MAAAWSEGEGEETTAAAAGTPQPSAETIDLTQRDDYLDGYLNNSISVGEKDPRAVGRGGARAEAHTHFGWAVWYPQEPKDLTPFEFITYDYTAYDTDDDDDDDDESE
eukprot:COSAG06_NODE_35396_length_460_cov_1.357341_1_plen_108_part_10